MPFKSDRQRKAVFARINSWNKLNTDQKAKRFFVTRFLRDPSHRVERSYFGEWKDRFHTGKPENYMDEWSRKVYNNLQSGTLRQAPTKLWKGVGGCQVGIEKVDGGIRLVRKDSKNDCSYEVKGD